MKQTVSLRLSRTISMNAVFTAVKSIFSSTTFVALSAIAALLTLCAAQVTADFSLKVVGFVLAALTLVSIVAVSERI